MVGVCGKRHYPFVRRFYILDNTNRYKMEHIWNNTQCTNITLDVNHCLRLV
jgi:hypothetical protein